MYSLIFKISSSVNSFTLLALGISKDEFEAPEVLSIPTDCEQYNPKGETDMINEVLTPEIDF